MDVCFLIIGFEFYKYMFLLPPDLVRKNYCFHVFFGFPFFSQFGNENYFCVHFYIKVKKFHMLILLHGNMFKFLLIMMVWDFDFGICCHARRYSSIQL
jgi:hypothetical protein